MKVILNWVSALINWKRKPALWNRNEKGIIGEVLLRPLHLQVQAKLRKRNWEDTIVSYPFSLTASLNFCTSSISLLSYLASSPTVLSFWTAILLLSRPPSLSWWACPSLSCGCPFQNSNIGGWKWPTAYARWAKPELLALVKDVPNLKTNSLEFEWNVSLIISAYQPDFSDLYQLIYILVGNVLTQEWMQLAE